MRFSILLEGHPFVSLFTVALFQLTSVSAFTQCYYPDGSIPTDYIWEPCTGSQYSSCCVLSEGDICQPNGLCYYPPYGQVYRGTCTDRTWDDPSCPDTCVAGFLSTWTWASECEGSGGSKSVACGAVDTDNQHSTPTCAGNAATSTAGFVTTTSVSSAHRYTPPPSLDPSVYSVWTSSYTIVLTANVQTETLTSTFASTFTSKINNPTTTASSSAVRGAGASSGSSVTASTKSKGVVLSTGALVAIIVGPILVIAICLAIFFLRKKQVAKKNEAIRLGSSAGYPPPNGPVGADQVHPYEVPSTEVSVLPQKYAYEPSKVGTYEMGDRAAVLEEKKRISMREMSANDHENMRSPVSLRSPAPAYAEAMMPVELDATPSSNIQYRPYRK